MILVSLPDHAINIYGVHTYNCKNGDKEIKVQTVEIFDPNGVKIEAVANDIFNGILFGNGLFYVKKEKNRVDIKDIFKGPLGVVFAAGTGDIDIFKTYLKKDGSNLNEALNGLITPLHLASGLGHKKIVDENFDF